MSFGQRKCRDVESNRRCVILGIGNSLMSDDGVGGHLIRRLGERHNPALLSANGIELIDGGTLGYLLIDRVAETDLLIVLDAAKLGALPGTYRTVEGAGVYEFLADRQNRSVHEVGLIDLIQMLDLSGEAPRELVVIAIQPESVDWGEDLSLSVQQAMPQVVLEVERLINAWLPTACEQSATHANRELCG
jgi:hydrogenase maturation protease